MQHIPLFPNIATAASILIIHAIQNRGPAPPPLCVRCAGRRMHHGDSRTHFILERNPLLASITANPPPSTTTSSLPPFPSFPCCKHPPTDPLSSLERAHAQHQTPAARPSTGHPGCALHKHTSQPLSPSISLPLGQPWSPSLSRTKDSAAAIRRRPQPALTTQHPLATSPLSRPSPATACAAALDSSRRRNLLHLALPQHAFLPCLTKRGSRENFEVILPQDQSFNLLRRVGSNHTPLKEIGIDSPLSDYQVSLIGAP